MLTEAGRGPELMPPIDTDIGHLFLGFPEIHRPTPADECQIVEVLAQSYIPALYQQHQQQYQQYQQYQHPYREVHHEPRRMDAGQPMRGGKEATGFHGVPIQTSQVQADEHEE